MNKKRLIRYVALSVNCSERYSTKKEALKDITSGSWVDEEVTLYKTDRPVSLHRYFEEGPELYMWSENIVGVYKEGKRIK